MEVDTKEFKEKQKLLEDELKKYKDTSKDYKSYMQCMDDVSVWLQEQVK